MLTFWELLLNVRFELHSHTLLRKPDFFVGDLIDEEEEILYDGNQKWLRQIEN